jgi:hypothetical protein
LHSAGGRYGPGVRERVKILLVENVSLRKRSFDSAGRFASESACCAQDDMERQRDEGDAGEWKSVGAAGTRRQLLRIQQVTLSAESQPHPVEIEVHDRSCEKGKRLAHYQPADDGYAQRAS